MPLNFVLESVSTGKIFCSTLENFQKKLLTPTTPLPRQHPFWQLWQDHCFSLQQPGNSDGVIDALIAIQRGHPTWQSRMRPASINQRREEMREFLSDHPPDVVLLSGMADYGFHLRARLWRYICINEDYVSAWMNTKQSTKPHLAYTALLRASIDHELGHWVQTLKAGHYDEVPSKSQKRTKHTVKSNPKSLRASWKRGGEAGDYVEVCSRGGVIHYSSKLKNAYIVTGPGPLARSELSVLYLREYKSSRDFPSRIGTSSRNLHALKTKADELFPYGNNDRCHEPVQVLGDEPGCLRIRPDEE